MSIAAMIRSSLLTIATFAAFLPGTAYGQIFGPRALGRSLRSPTDADRSAADSSIAGLPLVAPPTSRIGRRQSTFVGRDMRAAATFVGREATSAAASPDPARLALQQARAQEIRRRRARNANVARIQQGGGSSGATYVPRLAVDFSHPPAVSPVTARRAEDAVDDVFKLPQFRGVVATVFDGVATLRGRVESIDAKKLAAAIARLEPGVMEIDNRLRVEP